jgi:hypothetical protein
MNPDLLRDQLTLLHQELASAPRTDPRSAQLLHEIMQDIKRLTGFEGEGAGAPAPVHSLPERLEEIAVRFEVEHPTLAASSRRMVDLLGKIGV